MERIGDLFVAGATGDDARRKLAAPPVVGGQLRLGYAFLHINILKAVVSFGASKGFKDCLALRSQMSATRFKNAPPRDQCLTYEQVCAVRTSAIQVGLPSMALGVTIQAELAFRQKDVIGEWEDDELGTDGVRLGKRVWRRGLTWSHFGSDGVLRKRTSKTGKEAMHRISDYPDLVAEMDKVPSDRRVGPIVIYEKTGLPYTPEQYRREFSTRCEARWRA